MSQARQNATELRTSRRPHRAQQAGIPGSRTALAITVVVLSFLALRAFLPLWLPLVLAAWFAHLASPLAQRFGVWLHGMRRAASLVAVLLVLAVLAPVGVIVLSLAGDAAELFRSILESKTVESAFQALVAKESGPESSWSLLTQEPRRIFNLVRESGSSALGFASSVAGATISIVIGLVVFVMGFYVFLVDGSRWGTWLNRNLPLSRREFQRFSAAFFETGRGLIVGVGLAALVQGAIAGVGYVIAGVPHAFVLALLTAAAALVPSVGSGLVWVPVAGILAVSGRLGDGIAVFVVGSIAGASDNFIRPVLSRFGRLRLPTFVLFCAMLGGIMAFGAAGLIIGPLFARMALEGLRLWRRRSNPATASAARGH